MRVLFDILIFLAGFFLSKWAIRKHTLLVITNESISKMKEGTTGIYETPHGTIYTAMVAASKEDIEIEDDPYPSDRWGWTSQD